MHPDLQFCGLLPPLDAPHHLRRGDVATYREGIVVDNKDATDGTSLVDCGVPNRLVKIDRKVPPGVRCTVRLEPKAYETGQKGHMKGEVVSPTWVDKSTTLDLLLHLDMTTIYWSSATLKIRLKKFLGG